MFAQARTIGSMKKEITKNFIAEQLREGILL
jgi:hypothetical protein